MSQDQPTTRRSPLSRVGIAALNLLSPGLGLFRLGDWRAGALFFTAQIGAITGITFAMGLSPISSHASAVTTLAVIIGLGAAIILGSIAVTWRRSATRRPLQHWSRWYAIIAIAVGMNLLLGQAVNAAHTFYRPFYLPARSMNPTIGLQDRIVADMRWRGPYRRGQIIMFRHRGSDWIKRIAALPGDRIAMRNGVPVVNGTPALQAKRRELTIEDDFGRAKASVLREQFPGETGSHRVQDTTASPFDNTAEVVVPPGHLFVLGDNRDHSADSRVPLVEMGTGPVPISAVIGRPLFISWGSDRERTGDRLDR